MQKVAHKFVQRVPADELGLSKLAEARCKPLLLNEKGGTFEISERIAISCTTRSEHAEEGELSGVLVSCPN